MPNIMCQIGNMGGNPETRPDWLFLKGDLTM